MTDDKPPVHVLRDVKLAGEIVLDPCYDPPWPGAGITSVRKEGASSNPEHPEDGDGPT
jgi:hypothetical protein